MTKRSCKKGILVIAACLVLLLTGYALAAPPTKERPVVIDFECWLPPVGAGFQVTKKFFDDMAAGTGGVVKVQYHVGGAMGSGTESYARLTGGVTGATLYGPGYTFGVFPMFSIFDYPITFPSAEVLTKAMHKMYELGYFDKDFAKSKFLGAFSIGPYTLDCAKHKVGKAEQFKGLKIRAPTEGWVKAIRALGAIPVTMTSGEQYIALQKGIVDVVPNPWDGLTTYKLYEITKYVTNLSMMTFTQAVAMNKDKWNELPKEAKEYLDKNWKQSSIDVAKAYDRTAARNREMFPGKDGREIVNIDRSEWDKIGKLFNPIWNNWIAETEAKGLPGRKAVNDLYKILTELGVDKPIVGYMPK